VVGGTRGSGGRRVSEGGGSRSGRKPGTSLSGLEHEAARWAVREPPWVAAALELWISIVEGELGPVRPLMPPLSVQNAGIGGLRDTARVTHKAENRGRWSGDEVCPDVDSHGHRAPGVV